MISSQAYKLNYNLGPFYLRRIEIQIQGSSQGDLLEIQVEYFCLESVVQSSAQNSLQQQKVCHKFSKTIV